LVMSKTQMAYFEKKDILHVCIANGGEASSVELSPNITAELHENGDLIGIEILNVSSYIRDAVMETVHAKMFKLTVAGRLRLQTELPELVD
jgi:uncharacterized protein YuzE